MKNLLEAISKTRRRGATERGEEACFLHAARVDRPSNEASGFLRQLLGIAILLVISVPGLSSPIPGAVSIKPDLGVFKSPIGFEISAATSGWKMSAIPKSNSFIVGVFIPKQKSPASLTLRLDKLTNQTSLQTYVQRWQKEYPKYGFDVLGSKSFDQNGMLGYAIDLIQRDTRKEMRQVVFIKDKKAIVMTCKDREENFRNTLKECNQIMRTFKWSE